MRESLKRLFENGKTTPHKGMLIIFIVLSLLSASLVFLGPYTNVDSKHYFLIANSFVANGYDWTMIHAPHGIGPLYPLFLSMVVEPVNNSDILFPVMYYHYAMCVIIDIVVLLISFRLTRNWNVALFAATISALMIEKSLYAAYIKPDVMCTTLLLVSTLLFIIAIQRSSLLIYFTAFFFFFIAGYVRLGIISFWIFPFVCFTYSYIRVHNNKWKIPKLIVFAILFLAANLFVVSVASAPVKSAGGIREKMSLLWMRAIHYRPPSEELMNEVAPGYIKDYKAWKTKGETPAGVELDAQWHVNNPWNYIRTRGWEKRKMPIWVLTAQRGMTRNEALRWQAKVSVEVIKRRYKEILKYTAADISNAFTNEFVAWYMFTRHELKTFSERFSVSDNSYANIIKYHHRLSKLIKIVAFLGAFCGLFVVMKAEYFLLFTMTVGVSLFNIIVGGVGHSRYTISFIPFVGLYVYYAFVVLQTILRKYRASTA